MPRTQIEGETVIVVVPEEAVAFPAAERLRANIMKLSGESECNVILDCKNLKRIDVTVAKVGSEVWYFATLDLGSEKKSRANSYYIYRGPL